MRRQSLYLKFFVIVLLFWIGILLNLARDGPSDDRRQRYIRPRSDDLNWDSGGRLKQVQDKERVIEDPEPNRLRYEQRIRKETKHRVETENKLSKERSSWRMIEASEPWFSKFEIESPRRRISSSKASIINGVDDDTRRLIEQGLIVPKWDLIEEFPAIADGFGEFGVGVHIVRGNLSMVEELKEFDDGWERNAFNQYLSDRISLHRSLLDVRDEECKMLRYGDQLPRASVIIIFHKEALSVLLRTVHSVLDRSPPHLIEEIILVDDFSELDHLKEPLDAYVSRLLKVRVVRDKKREGLIRARLLGASVAIGEVLIFLDSHCECTMGWLEPLLDRIAENHSNVVTPMIDIIEDDTLRYNSLNAEMANIGGFTWDLQFDWNPMPDRERNRRKSDVDPIRTPTMAGGLFAISREYFEHLGAYDPGMDIWGGENLELSFKIWMCGGILETVVCSHVGHIFRKRMPYEWPTEVNVLRRNSVRLAEVWMDGYAKYYYDRFDDVLGDYGDVSSRKELRKRLQCKTFDWYLKNIYPELKLPGAIVASGEIRNKVMGTFSDREQPACVDRSYDVETSNTQVVIWSCHHEGDGQYWTLNEEGEIRCETGCVDYDREGSFVMIYPCHGLKENQEWIYGGDNTLRQPNTNLCLQISDDGTELEMKPCIGTEQQIWYWPRRANRTTTFAFAPH